VSPRNFCYDTEFLENGETIELISIGIVGDDGREYYAVNSDMPTKRLESDEWMCKNVIPHLPLKGEVNRHTGSSTHYWTLDASSTLVKPKWVIANEVREFILECIPLGDTPKLWAYYGAYDHVALAQLFGKMIHLPDGIPMWTHELMQLMESMPGSWEPPTQDEDEHHALADARWNMRVLKSIQEVL
jgi:hypothetical protein